LLALVVFVLLIPAVAPLALAMPDAAAMTPEVMGAAIAGLGATTRGILVLYALALAAALIWLVARLVLLNPVVVNERAGVASIRRSFALTHGLTWKIIGLAILFLIVAGVVRLAARLVSGIVFGLALGDSNAGLAAMLAAAVVGAVTAGITIVWACFVAQLYLAAVGRTPAAA
jgi:hypothetical protein